MLAFFVCLAKAGNTFAITLTPETDTKIINLSDDTSRTIKTRFAGNIPYVSMNEVWKMMLSPNLTIEPIAPKKYSIKTPYGEATIDTESDILRTSDFVAFTTKSSEENEEIPASIKIYKQDIIGIPTPTTIDFSKYHIDLEGDENGIWLPAQTAFDLIFEACFFNGENLYLVTGASIDSFMYSQIYKSLNEYYFASGQGKPDLGSFLYNEICLIFDYIYGMPGRSVLSSSIRQFGLDYTLDHFDTDTIRIKEWLTANSLEGYFKGLSLLNDYLNDGGHTNLDFSLMPYVGYRTATELSEDLESYAKHKERTQLEKTEFQAEIEITNARNTIFGEDNKYIEDGDIAIFSFDGFSYDQAGWTAYHDGTGATYPNDTLGNVLAALDKAAQNPNIKYFVFDVSTNSGGLGIVAPIIMSNLGFQGTINFHENINNRTEQIKLDADSSIHQEYDFKYGLITSRLTFSTGNLFTSLAKENGFMLLGETSGGGACSVKLLNTVEGSLMSMSSPSCLVNQAGDSIDAGIEPDVKLAYQNYFDLKTLSALLNDFYTEETPSDQDEDNQNTDGQHSNDEHNDKEQATRYLNQVVSEPDETSLKSNDNEQSSKTNKKDGGSQKETEDFTKKPEKNLTAQDEPNSNILPVVIIVIVVIATGTIIILAYKNRRR